MMYHLNNNKFSLNDTLNIAINDFKNHGYDTKSRLKKWKSRIDRALIVFFYIKLNNNYKNTLYNTYKINIIKGLIGKELNIKQYKIIKIKNKLFTELKKQQMSLDLIIKTRRLETKEKVIRKFVGWVSSLDNKTKNKEINIANIRRELIKPIISLSLEERRVIYDQNIKLINKLKLIVAKENNVIAVRWEAFPENKNYIHRQEHLERQGKFFLIKNSNAMIKGLVKKNNESYYDDIDHCGELPNCKCAPIMIFNLDQLPDNILTIKGRAALRKE